MTMPVALSKISSLHMSRHGSQERMDAGSPSEAPPSASLSSSTSGSVLRSCKRRRVSRDGSCSTSTGSVVTAFSGATDIFDGRSTTAYKNWLQAVQPTAATHDFASFIGKKVEAHADGVWTTGMDHCLHQGIMPSMTRTLPTDTLLPNKSQPFSIVWADNTDSICDLPSALTFLDNFTSNRYRTNATSSSPATGRSARRASNGAAAPSSLPSSSSLPQPPLPPHNAPAAAPASAGIFAGIPSGPGDLVDNLTRSGSFSFLSELFDTESLFDLRDFPVSRVMPPKGDAVEQLAASMHLVLDLADKYPHNSIAAHILDCVAQFLPALLCPCTRRGRVRHVVSNGKRFQRGD